MINHIHLFIDGREVEFSKDPSILYNYKETDLTNPTTVKNSFSKTIEIEGTNINNSIFGHIWNLERWQDVGEYGGPSFDPTKKASFELYVNGDLYEKGYCKLVDIRKTGNYIVYGITLFGGVGSFFSNLQSRGNDDEKLTLADLDFDGVNLDFNITKETVDDAWHRLAGDSQYGDPYRKYDYINFAVTSEGIPEGFSADKFIINNRNNLYPAPEGAQGFQCVYDGNVQENGYIMADMSKELTMDTSFDLRSYLLRPVVNVSKIFDAIRNPANNGGWEVQFDSHFFQYENPYYSDAWMTLPRIPELNLTHQETNVVTGSLTKDGTNYYDLNFTKGNCSNVDLAFTVYVTPETTPSSDELYCNTTVTTSTPRSRISYIERFGYSGSYVIKLEALNDDNEVVGEGDPIVVCSQYGSYVDSSTKGAKNTVVKTGYLVKKAGTYVFCDFSGNTLVFHTKLRSYSNWTRLRLNVVNPFYESEDYTGIFVAHFDSDYSADLLVENKKQLFYYEQSDYMDGDYSYNQVKYRHFVYGEWGIQFSSLRSNSDEWEEFISGTPVPKSVLLKTNFSVADFLLSYSKLFGLYFYYDPNEEPSLAGADKGVIHIMDRDTFFTDEVVDINELIDRKKTINIVPRTAQTKWYSFSYGSGEGEAETEFKNNYGYTYGRQLVNTDTNFDSDVTELYTDNIFKNGVMVQEKDSAFALLRSGLSTVWNNGFTYYHYKENSSGELDTVETVLSGTKSTANISPINNSSLLYFDSLPKLQIHKEENGAGAGENILLFFDSMQNVSATYYLTDDVPDMWELNDGTPCWLQSYYYTTDAGGNTIVIPRTSLPFFTRDIYDSGVSGNIIHSWNFGHPRETYVPMTASTDGDCIYDKMWKNYFSDLYSNNNKIVTASMWFKGKPSVDWLRRFYWWDNSIWKMNSIKDWDISSYDSTEVEFIKVLDMENYQLERISYFGDFVIILDQTQIGKSGGTVTGRIKQQGNYYVSFDETLPVRSAGGNEYWDSATYISPMSGTGTVIPFTVTIPANPTNYNRIFQLKVWDNNDNNKDAFITQFGNDGPELYFNPSTYSVGGIAQTLSLNYVATNMNNATLTASATSWITVGTISNGILSVSIPYNSGSNRSGTVTLTGTGLNGNTLTATATINQSTGVVTVNAEPSSITFDYDRSSTSPGSDITITSNGSWTLTSEDI